MLVSSKIYKFLNTSPSNIAKFKEMVAFATIWWFVCFYFLPSRVPSPFAAWNSFRGKLMKSYGGAMSVVCFSHIHVGRKLFRTILFEVTLDVYFLSYKQGFCPWKECVSISLQSIFSWFFKGKAFQEDWRWSNNKNLETRSTHFSPALPISLWKIWGFSLSFFGVCFYWWCWRIDWCFFCMEKDKTVIYFHIWKRWYPAFTYLLHILKGYGHGNPCWQEIIGLSSRFF